MKKAISYFLSESTRLCASVCLLVSSGAHSAESQPAAPPATASAGSAAAPSVTGDRAGDYRLGAADSVRIIVFNEPTLSGEFSVGDNGMLSLPLIGGVQASGRTPTEVSADIEAKLADGYLRSPHVSLDVLTYRPFYILGEVTKPGEYPYASGLTIMGAVATASGFTYRANKHRVFVKRGGDHNEKELEMTPSMLVYPGDTIRIAERHF
jgi:polysaccharide export outer membrane protein